MATAKESHACKQFAARNSSFLDHMAHPLLDKNISLPSFPPYKCTAYPGQYASELPGLYTGQQDAVGGLSKPLSPYCNFSYPTENMHLKDSQCALSCGIGIGDKPFGVSFAPQRRFLIFDRSENHTRLFVSPFSSQEQILTSKTPASVIGSLGKLATQVDKMKPIVEEKWDENHLPDGEGEMLEDTEEINALLYSDSDDDYDDDGENDEVSSTGHSPPFSRQEDYDRVKSRDEVKEEVVSCDEPPKRQRLLDGKYKKPSLESGVRAMNVADSCSYEDDVESRCGDDDGGIGSNKVKIRQALKMLESIIPGLDKKDPLSIIDRAIAYLKSMKTEAESLGLNSLPHNLSSPMIRDH